jgi:small subunit ribosomal protein S16
MKRLGRKGHPTYRVVVQDSRQSPASGKYVAHLGSYDPHTKQSSLVKDKAEFYLKNGAQPSDRVISLFKTEKITLPEWVKQPTKKEKSTRNPDKLRKNRPADAAADSKPEASDQPQEAAPTEEDKTAEAKAKPEETKADNQADQAKADEPKLEESKTENDTKQAGSEDEKPEKIAEESSAEDKA